MRAGGLQAVGITYNYQIRVRSAWTIYIPYLDLQPRSYRAYRQCGWCQKCKSELETGSAARELEPHLMINMQLQLSPQRVSHVSAYSPGGRE